jgi:hypothetical protein
METKGQKRTSHVIRADVENRDVTENAQPVPTASLQVSAAATGPRLQASRRMKSLDCYALDIF